MAAIVSIDPKIAKMFYLFFNKHAMSHGAPVWHRVLEVRTPISTNSSGWLLRLLGRWIFQAIMAVASSFHVFFWGGCIQGPTSLTRSCHFSFGDRLVEIA